MKTLIQRAIVVLALGSGLPTVRAEESYCARVKIEIEQQMTLERQAFDARMTVDNGLPNSAMEEIGIDLQFSDADGNAVTATTNPNNTNALFFVRLTSQDDISAIDGTGVIQPSSQADIHWLIIPAAGAGGQDPRGSLYFVGAEFRYRLLGREQTETLTPDSIRVQPMPMLALDYFLPETVYGDDPFTELIEPPVPFSLGLRVRNAGWGPARNLKIESAQPRIVENLLGLLVGFTIVGSEVDGQTGSQSLFADFGTVEPGAAGVARWIMEASLTGEFTDFNASFTHADELGGELTSLIEDVQTHTLVHDVLVDLPGRDNIRDFLGQDGTALTVYESDAVDGSVTDLTYQSTFTLVQGGTDDQVYNAALPRVGGPLYGTWNYSQGATREVKSVVRDDGKILPLDNAWISKRRDRATDPWEYSFHLFDSDRGGTYRVTFAVRENAGNQAPVLAYIGPHSARVNEALGFVVAASDADGPPPALSTTGMPAGATFVDGGNGWGTFSWVPPPEAYGVHPVAFRASDGTDVDDEIVRIYVGLAGEAFNADGIPVSLANWTPPIKSVVACSVSGIATVKWDSACGILYRLYWSDDPLGGFMTWHQEPTRVGLGSEEVQQDAGLGTSRNRRFYQLTLVGEAPASNGIWGLMRRDLSIGFNMVSPPLRTDRAFDGQMGRMLAEQMTGNDDGIGGVGDEVYLLQADGSWRMLYLDGQKVWRESNGNASTYELAPGEGFFVLRGGPTASRMTFTGPVGNDGLQTNWIAPGWNILGLSEGKSLDIKATFQNSGAMGGAAEETADMVVLQNPNGSWRRIMYVQGWGAPYDGNWFDLSTFTIVTNKLEPGSAYYYYRQPNAGNLGVGF